MAAPVSLMKYPTKEIKLSDSTKMFDRLIEFAIDGDLAAVIGESE